MKSFIKIVIGSFIGLYAMCAFVSWDVAVMANTSESGRVGYIMGSLFISGVIACIIATIQSEK